MAFLRDPVWQFVGAFLALLAVVMAYIQSRRQSSRKSLAYEILTNSSLVSFDDDIKDKLQVLFNGKPVANLRLIALRIYNSGDIPIQNSDYERPIEIIFGEKAEVLDAGILETNPNNIRASVKVTSKIVELSPVLLNSGDSIKLKMVVNQKDNNIDVDGRIVGVKEISKFDMTRFQQENDYRLNRPKTNWIYVVIAFIMIVMLTYLALILNSNTM